MLCVVVIATVLGSWYYTAYAVDAENDPVDCVIRGSPVRRLWLWARGRYRFVDISDEFKSKVIEIVDNDPDGAALLAEGYTFKEVRPNIQVTVGAEGELTAKVVEAILVLERDETKSHAAVWVNIEEERVTRITTLTRTVIEK